MKVVIKSRTLCVWSCFVLLRSVVGAMEPVEQAIPCTWDFSTWDASSTNYPPGVIGWKIKGGASTNFSVVPASTDPSPIAPSDASKTTGGLHNYAGKLGILDTSSGGYSLACAVSTTGKTSVTVEYDMMTLRNPYASTNNTRINACTLQYRIGTTGNFTLTGLTYTNDSTQQTSGVTPQNPRTQTFIFPSSCDNQPILQLRWAVRDLTGIGSRPSFAIARIQVTGENTPLGLLPPQNIRVTGITTKSFNLIWDAAPLATAYAIDIYALLNTRTEPFFDESFDGFAGASNVNHEDLLDTHTETNGWSGVAIYESTRSIRLGTGETRGWIQTPPLSPPGTYSICFDACAWNGTSEKTNIDVYALQGATTNVLGTIQLSKTTMQSYVIQTTSAAGTILGFTAKQNTENRFFLDNLSLIPGYDTPPPSRNNLIVSNTTANIQGLTSGLSYRGVIRAINGSDQSVNSTEFTVKTFCATLIMLN